MEDVVTAEIRSSGHPDDSTQATSTGDSAELKLRGYWCETKARP